MIYVLLYNAALTAFLVLGAPWLWRRIRPEAGVPGRWTERFGVYPPEALPRRARSTIWIQTVSVGELLSITPLVRMLRERHPDSPVLITVTTRSGRRIAARNFPDIPCFYFPVDLPFVLRRTFRTFRPSVLILVETEIWPNLLRFAFRNHVPALLINGRLSPKSRRRYRAFSFFLRRILPLYAEISMRTRTEARHLALLGAPKNRIRVAGSIKFDQALAAAAAIRPGEVRERLGILENRRIVVLGSLHPGEEEPCLSVALRLLRKHADLLIVLVPRFLDRSVVFRCLDAQGIPCARRSRLPQQRDLPLWVVDTYGELNQFYSICDVAFVGGSLIPWGGQNPIEPAAFGKPVLFGTYQWHFLEEWERIRDGGGGREVVSYRDLEEAVSLLVEHPEEASRMGARAREVVEGNCGATLRTLNMIERHLRPPSCAGAGSR